MYQVSIFNNNVETLIHYPTASKEAPHLLAAKWKGKLSQPDELNFTIPYMSQGWGKLKGLQTKVKVIDTRDNSVLFSGRVMPYQDGMNDNGAFTGETTCLGALDYLNDIHTRRWNYENKTPQYILQEWLNYFNSKVDLSRKIYLGVIEVTQPITIDTNNETILNAIVTKIHNVLGGDIRVQERNGLLYLDYLTDLGENKGVEIRLGANMKSITREYDPTDVVTQLICKGYGEGINQLGIEKVNNGLDYIQDDGAYSIYGAVEGLYTNKDLQNADTLKLAGKTVLNEKKQPRLTIDTKMVDRSVLAQYSLEKYNLGDTLRIINEVLDIDLYARTIETEIDLMQPHIRSNVISTRPISLTNQIIDLKQRNMTLENAPQGNTCIFPLMKAENVDFSHPIEFDLDIPQEAININRVYLNIHGRKFRANSTGVESGGGDVVTSESGGEHVHIWASFAGTTDELTEKQYLTKISPTFGGGVRTIGLKADSIGDCWTDNVSTKHSHRTKIKPHTHEASYGIYESTYPKNVKIKVNGQDIGINIGNGNDAFDQYNVDILAYVHVGNNKIQITTEQNGRIDSIIYSQIFIQSK